MPPTNSRAAEERGRALVPFVGQYVSLVTRSTPGTDDAEARPGQLFIGILAKFDATTIVLAGVVQIDLRTRRICPFAASGGEAASPVYLTAQFKQLSRVARCATGTLYKLFRDPNRPCIPMAPSEEEDRAARLFLRSVFIRRYVFTELREKVRPPTENDDENQQQQRHTAVGTTVPNGDAAGSSNAAGAEGGDDNVDESLETAVTEAVGGAPPTSTDEVSRIRMPVASSIKSHLSKINRAQRPADRDGTGGDSNGAGDEEGQQTEAGGGDDEGAAAAATDDGAAPSTNPRRNGAAARGPPVAMDQSSFATILRAIPAEIGKMCVADVRQLVSDECLELRRLYAPRKISPATRLNETVHAFIKACFFFTIVLSVLFCVLGGIMIGGAVSGPLTSGGLAGDFAAYMWYLLIVPGVLSACHGVSLSARGEDAASPVSKVPKIWLGIEIFVVVLLAPGFVFSVMFLDNESTPRAEHSTAREYWEALASRSDEKICAFQESERCSGYSQPCYIAGNATTVFIIQRPDCAVACRMSLDFLRNLPSATCGKKFTAPVRSVSTSTIVYMAVFAVFAFARLIGLALIRRYYSRQAVRIHAEMLARFTDEQQAQQQAQQQQAQQQQQEADQQQPPDQEQVEAPAAA